MLKFCNIRITEFDLKEHHWPIIISASLSIAFFILVSYFVTVSAYNASDIIGQTDSEGIISYTTNFPNNSSPSNDGFSSPFHTEIDEINNRLFISDYNNNRVLVFNLDDNHDLLDYTADYVFGQTDFTSFESGLSTSTMDSPLGLEYDSVSSTLFVSDSANNRVLVFDLNGGLEQGGGGMNASYVLGQSDFATSSSNVTTSTFNNPGGLSHSTSTNKLYVADRANNRVLIFDTAEITNGEDAVDILGQTNFTNNSSANTAEGFYFLTSLLVVNNEIFVTDGLNHRVLGFELDSSGLPVDNTADSVLGQTNFTNNSASVSTSTINLPYDLAYDSTSSTLFVVDANNARVLLFDLSDGVTNGEDAIRILGQESFDVSFTYQNNVNNITVTSDTLALTTGITYSTTNNKLFVVDYNNNRVVVFDTSEVENGEDAVDVLGQTDASGLPVFTTNYANNSGTNNTGLYAPRGAVLDAVGNRLFIADNYNFRVLVFNLDGNHELLDYEADYVLGQADFSSHLATTTRSGMEYGRDIDFDSDNNYLYVVDSFNNRIVVYDVATIDEGGEDAIYVLGQDDFTSSVAATTQNGMDTPRGVYYESVNDYLYVGDYGNNRILVFDLSGGLEVGSAGMDANFVIGQTDFVSKVSARTATGLGRPIDILYASSTEKLFVSDYGNHRVLVYDLSDGLATTTETAINVLGSSSLTAFEYTASINTMYNPLGMAFGPTINTLFIGDDANSRILLYDIAEIIDGEDAIAVIGQDDFVSDTSSAPTQDSMSTYHGSIDFDNENNRLYVTDANYHRLLMYDFIEVESGSLIAGEVGTAYSQTIISNDQGTLTSEVTSGSLPPGLSLSGDTISGTPTALGNYTFTVFATDTFANTGYFYDEQEMTIEISQPLSQWSYRKKITIDADQVDADLTDFPVLVSFSADSNLATNATSTGADIIFVPSSVSWASDTAGDRYDYEIESFSSSTGAIVAWVKIPTLSSSVDTDIYLYYGNSDASSGLESTDTWNSNYVMVHHLEETTGTSTDSTSNSNDGTAINGVGRTVSGKIGDSDSFDGIDDEISLGAGNNMSVYNSDYTYSTWLKTASTSQEWQITYTPDTSSYAGFHINVHGGGKIYYYTYIDGDDGDLQTIYENPLDENTWYYLTVTRDGTTGETIAYVNDSVIGSFTAVGTSGLVDDGPRSISSEEHPFNGSIDETRLSTAVNSPDWISTEYNNQNNPEDFYTISVEQDQTGTSLSDWSYRKKITIDADQVDADLSDFPVLVSFSADANLSSQAQSDGDDIIFAPSSAVWASGDTNSRYAHEIELYTSATGEIVAWVKIPELSSSVDTDIYMYYGNSSNSDLSSGNVWDENYVLVQHLEETSGSITDSTDFSLDGTAYNFNGNSSSTLDAAGKIGGGDLFDGSDDYIDFGNNSNFDLASINYTMSVWARLGNVENPTAIFFDKWLSYSFMYVLPVDRVQWAYKKTLGTVALHDQPTETSDGEWHLLSGSFDNGTVYLSIDGEVVTSTLSNDYPLKNYSEYDLWLGGRHQGSGNKYIGYLDEARISHINRSSSWFSTEYSNQNNPVDFYNLSPELETSGTDLSNWNYRKKITVDSSYVAGDLVDFPVHIDLSSDTDFVSKANSDGSDIMIVPASVDWTSGTTNDRHMFEIVSYSSSTGALEAYVNIFALSDSADTEFYIYYNNTSQTTSLEDISAQNGSSAAVQSESIWTSTVSNNDNEELDFSILSEEEFYDQSSYHLEITGNSTQIPANSQIITLTVQDGSDSSAALFDGEKTVVFSGANSDGSGNQPTCSDKDNNDIGFGSNTTITFTNGVGVCVLKLYREENISVDAVTGLLNTSVSSFYDLGINVTTNSGGSSAGGVIQDKSFKINDGSSLISSRFVTLYMSPGSGVKSMAISNDESFEGINVENYKEEINWTLAGEDGLNKVFVKFWYEDGSTSGILSASVILDIRPTISSPVEGEEILETPFIVKGTSEVNTKVEITIGGTTYSVWTNDEGVFSVDILDQLIDDEYEITVVQIYEDGFRGKESIRKIKFGKESKYVEQEDVDEYIEIGDEQVITTPGQEVGDFVEVTPSDEVSDVLIESPTEEDMVEELKEVEKKEAFLLVMKQGSVGYYKEQVNGIETVGGESVEILLRPKQEVHSVVGRLYEISADVEKVSLLQRIKNWFTETVYAQGDDGLKKWVDAYVFEYDELYNVYRTDVTPPNNNGNEYQLVISINNEDGTRVDLKKNIITVYKGHIQSKGHSVAYSRIEIFRQNDDTKEYQKWDASLYGSENPIFTDENGKYAMKLPPGAYYFNIAAPGYENYQSKIYLLSEPTVLNDEVSMERSPYSWWFRFWEWVKRVV
ncbi:DUF2341 domain-containing protein [Candidatus Parcubacteria bacterium]|nr:DUF2341 domain-containing protein [Candidatus Parcubacteria bacterium]